MDYSLAMSLGPTELIVLLVVVLLFFGPKRLPELGSAVGKGIKSFKKATTDPIVEDEPEPEEEKKDA